jgi:hypothetical protein
MVLVDSLAEVRGMATAIGAGRPMLERMKRAALLDSHVYEEVEADTTATGQAAAVVAIVAVAQGLGAASLGPSGIIAATIAALVAWLVWAGVTYLIGDKILGGTATWGELLRTLGFAQSPGLLGILAFLPLLGGLIRFAITIWVLIAGIIAIRQALDFGTGKAIFTAVIGWLALAIPMALLGAAAR